jgi:hypothetical protein
VAKKVARFQWQAPRAASDDRTNNLLCLYATHGKARVQRRHRFDVHATCPRRSWGLRPGGNVSYPRAKVAAKRERTGAELDIARGIARTGAERRIEKLDGRDTGKTAVHTDYTDSSLFVHRKRLARRDVSGVV